MVNGEWCESSLLSEFQSCTCTVCGVWGFHLLSKALGEIDQRNRLQDNNLVGGSCHRLARALPAALGLDAPSFPSAPGFFHPLCLSLSSTLFVFPFQSTATRNENVISAALPAVFLSASQRGRKTRDPSLGSDHDRVTGHSVLPDTSSGSNGVSQEPLPFIHCQYLPGWQLKMMRVSQSRFIRDPHFLRVRCMMNRCCVLLLFAKPREVVRMFVKNQL